MVQKLSEIICKISLSSHQLYVTKKVTYYAGNLHFVQSIHVVVYYYYYYFLFAIMTLKYNKNKKKIQKDTKRERE